MVGVVNHVHGDEQAVSSSDVVEVAPGIPEEVREEMEFLLSEREKNQQEAPRPNRLFHWSQDESLGDFVSREVLDTGVQALRDARGFIDFRSPIDQEVRLSEDNFRDLQTTKLGTSIYASEVNPFIQDIRFRGRYHFQALSAFGNDANDQYFGGDFTEHRRSRLILESDIFRYFHWVSKKDFVIDRRFNPENSQIRIDELYWLEFFLSVRLHDLFEVPYWDELNVSYGRQTLRSGFESYQSSRDIFTLERSAVSLTATAQQRRVTSLMLYAKKNDLQINLGLMSHSQSSFVGDWGDGLFFYASGELPLNDNWDFNTNLVVNENQRNPGSLDYAWMWHNSVHYQKGDWGVAIDWLVGDRGGASDGNPLPSRQGLFTGVVLMPYRWFVEDKYQGVIRMEGLVSSRSEGVRMIPRYTRNFDLEPGVDLNEGRGNRYFSTYLGLNYHPFSNFTKVMVGCQYEYLSSPRGGVSAFSSLVALRIEL